MPGNIFDECRRRQWARQALESTNRVMEHAYGDLAARQDLASLYSDEAFDLADRIFPERRPGLRFDVESELGQAASVLAIVDMAQRLSAGTIELVPALGIIQGEAAMILSMQKVIEDPLGLAFGGRESLEEVVLPEPHHELAEWASSIASIIEDIKVELACSHGDERLHEYLNNPPYGPPTHIALVRFSIRLSALLLAIRHCWLKADLRRGLRVRVPRYWEALRAGLKSRRGSAKGIQRRKEHAADVRKQRHLEERDRMLAKEIHATWQALRKKGRGRSVPLSEALSAVRAVHVERLVPILRQRYPAYDDRALRKKAEEGLSLSLLRQAYAKHYGSPRQERPKRRR